MLPLFREVGRDLSTRWPTAAHFICWLNLCPDNDISGGRVLWKGTRKVQNQAGQLFRIAAYSLHRSPTPPRKLPATHEVQTRTQGSHHRDRTQDRHYFLHHSHQTGRI
jgi:hypothetical protein